MTLRKPPRLNLGTAGVKGGLIFGVDGRVGLAETFVDGAVESASEGFSNTLCLTSECMSLYGGDSRLQVTYVYSYCGCS